MSIKPAGSVLTIGAYDLILDSIDGPSPDVQFFDRMEFSHDRLRQAMNVDGSKPVFLELVGGKLIQYSNTCNSNDTVRPLTPDDSDYDNIYRRFDIQRWTFRGASTVAANVDGVWSAIAVPMKVKLNQFQSFLQEAKASVSYAFLTTPTTGLQDRFTTFLSTFTATGVSMSGMALGTGTPLTVTNIMLISFTMSPEYEEPTNSGGTTSRVLRSWAATVETRIEKAARSNLF